MILRRYRNLCFTAPLMALWILGTIIDTACAAETTTDVPHFVDEGCCPETYRTEAARVIDTEITDVVLLKDGLRRGLRTGMQCSVTREEQPIGELILVDVRPEASAALITQLNPGSFIQAGDTVTPNALRFE